MPPRGLGPAGAARPVVAPYIFPRLPLTRGLSAVRLTEGEIRAATWGRPYWEHREYNTEPTAGASPRPTGCVFRGARRLGAHIMVGASGMPRPTASHHPTSAAPRGSTREGASKPVARTALRFCRTVATGGRTARRQRPPRAGTFPPDFRTKLPRKRGSGGGQHWRPIRADVATPGDLFAPFGSLQKGLAAGAAKCPPIKWYSTNPAGGASPSPTDAKCLNSPGGRRAQWSRPTQMVIVACPARRTTGEHQGRRVQAGSTDSPQVLPHSGNGREDGEASEATPHRYSCAGFPNQALP